MNETEFNQLTTKALSAIETWLEAEREDADFELQAGGVLEIECSDGSKVIVNRHAVAQEIWVAARSGGFHFRYDGQAWCDTRDGVELMARLAGLIS